MKNELKGIFDYLSTVTADSFPQYILKKEILKETPTTADVNAIHMSKWYKQLADEQ